MKYLIIGLLCLSLANCKKSGQGQDEFSPVTVTIDISSPLTIDLKLVNQDASVLLDVKKISAHQTLTSLGARSGDKLTLSFNTNIINPDISNGAVGIFLSWKGITLKDISGSFYKKDSDYVYQITVP